MSYLRNAAVASLVMVAFLRIAAGQEPAQPAGSISGTVTVDGKPAGRVTVRVIPSDRGAEGGAVAQAVTNKDGEFLIENVPSGRYVVSPFVAGYATVESVHGWAGKLASVSGGERVPGVHLQMIKGGVITGKITNADGQPVVDEDIRLRRLQDDGTASDVPYMREVSRPQTDDRGIYRFFGLAPGKYLVSVGKNTGAGAQQLGFAMMFYQETFYPGVTEESRATPVDVAAGGEAREINIAVARPMNAMVVEGQVVDGDTGSPIPDVHVLYGPVMSMEAGERIGMMSGVQTDRDGRFAIQGVLAGRYGAFVSPNSETGKDVYSNVVEFVVKDEDIDGLLIEASRGQTMNGTAVLDGPDDPAVVEQFARLSLTAYPRDENRAALRPLLGSHAQIQADGGFQFSGLAPGQYVVVLNTWNGPKGFAMLRLEHNGVPASQVVVEPEQPVTGVRVTVGYGTGAIKGTIDYERAPGAAGLYLGLTVNRVGLTHGIGNHQPTDARGRFLIDGLPPGDYEVHAASYDSKTRVKKYRGKTTVTVSNGSETPATIVIEEVPDERGGGE